MDQQVRTLIKTNIDRQFIKVKDRNQNNKVKGLKQQFKEEDQKIQFTKTCVPRLIKTLLNKRKYQKCNNL